jgi:conjugative relaxase-like TrwC/TraI family protein
MLTVAAIQGASQAASYFARDNYYTRNAEAPSVWAGREAAALGLAGPVDPATLEKMLQGKLPDGTELGTIRNGEWQHKPGWDLTFSAPKSVSLMALVAGDTQLLNAHDRAVLATLAYVERTAIYTRVREDGEVTLVQTDNMAAAVFPHDTNREKEPQLHTHAVVMNATRTADGQWRSIESRPLMQQIKALGQIYRSFLAAEVTRLGYQIAPDKGGFFEIAGVDRQTIQQLSSRSAAIEDRLADRGLTRATATTAQKAEATLATRPRKEELGRTDLQAGWRDRLGVGMPALEALMREAQRRVPALQPQATSAPQAPIDVPDSPNAPNGATHAAPTILPSGAVSPAGGVPPPPIPAAAFDAIDKAIAHLSEREQAFSHVRLLQNAIRFSIGGANPNELTRAVAARINEGRLVPRRVIEPSPESRRDEGQKGYTTPAGIRSEQALFALLDNARGTGRPLVSDKVASASVAAAERYAQARGSEWNDGQRQATLGILQSSDRIALLQGWAGTAKTSTVIATVAGAAAAAGYTVRAHAPSASAAQTLGGALQVEGTTVHRFLHETERADRDGKSLLQRVAELFKSPRPELWIVDEMSLLGVDKTVELLTAAERRGAKVLLVGDRMQLGSVEAGKAFDQALDRSLPVFRLTDIVRQKTEAGRAAVNAIIERNPVAALGQIVVDHGNIVQIDANEQLSANRAWQMRIDNIADRYVKLAPHERPGTIVIDPSREGGEAIKAAVRQRLQKNGELAGPIAPGTRLLDASMSNAEKTIAKVYVPGQIVRAGYEIIGIKGKMSRGEYGTVQGVIPGRDIINLRKADGSQVAIDTRTLNPERFDVFDPHSGDLQVNDRIRWNRNDPGLKLARGNLGTVQSVVGKTVTIAFDKGKTYTISVGQTAHQHYDYAYAVTAYGAQGMTKNWILHGESWRINLVNWRSMYVGMSRGEVSGTIVTNSADKLKDAISNRAGEKSAAIDPALAASVQIAAQTAIAAGQTAATVPARAKSPDEPLHRASAQAHLATMKAAAQAAAHSDAPAASPPSRPTHRLE